MYSESSSRSQHRRASPRGGEEMLLQAIASVHSCSYMCVSVAEIQGHRDKPGKGKKHVYEPREVHQTVPASASRLISLTESKEKLL